MPRVDSEIGEKIWAWIGDQRARQSTMLITRPNGAAEARLGRWLPKIGFGATNSIHDVRALWYSRQHRAGFPLVGQAEQMAHRRPSTALENYVLTRHLRQADFASQQKLTPLSCRIVAHLTGYSPRISPIYSVAAATPRAE